MKHDIVDVNLQDHHGRTALMCASLSGNTENGLIETVIELLKHYNMHVNRTDKYGWTTVGQP